MEYLHTDLGMCRGGQTVIVTLEGDSMNVRLMDATNFRQYQNGGDCKFYGGHAVRSPVRLQIPHGGHWHLVVDRGGYAGKVRAQVQVVG